MQNLLYFIDIFTDKLRENADGFPEASLGNIKS